MKNLVRLGVAAFVPFVPLVATLAGQEQQCRATIQLESTQFASSAWVHPRLVSSGPGVVYVVHPSDGGEGYSVERVPEQPDVMDAQGAGPVHVERTKLARRTRKHTLPKDELLAIDWREVATEQSRSGDEFTIPAGTYRFSLLFSESFPTWSGKVMQVCRAYSKAFVLANDSKLGTNY